MSNNSTVTQLIPPTGRYLVVASVSEYVGDVWHQPADPAERKYPSQPGRIIGETDSYEEALVLAGREGEIRKARIWGPCMCEACKTWPGPG